MKMSQLFHCLVPVVVFLDPLLLCFPQRTALKMYHSLPFGPHLIRKKRARKEEEIDKTFTSHVLIQSARSRGFAENTPVKVIRLLSSSNYL